MAALNYVRCRFFMAMVCLTTVIGLAFLVGALVLGLSLHSKHAAFWLLSTFVCLLAQAAIFEPLKILAFVVFWATVRRNVPK